MEVKRTLRWILPLALLWFWTAPLSALEPSSSSASSASAASLDHLEWLAGCWVQEQAGSRTEECWLAPQGGMMLGVNRSVNREGRASFEYLRIVTDDEGVVYYASPAGKPATPFRLTIAEGRKAVFENPQHDYPQRLEYRLEDTGLLHVRVEGGGHGFELVWSKTTINGKP